MFKRIFILSVLLSAFFMLQVHNVMPHQHIEQVVNSHSHKHDPQHHDHTSKTDHSSPLNNADHSTEFGKALIKPGYSKYQIGLVKLMPLILVANSTELVRLSHNIVPELRPGRRDRLIPPAPYLQGIGFRGPPSFV